MPYDSSGVWWNNESDMPVDYGGTPEQVAATSGLQAFGDLLFDPATKTFTHSDGRPVNWGTLAPEMLAMTGVTDATRQTAEMTPEQRARWAMDNIEGFDEQSRSGALSREGAYNQWKSWDKYYDSSCPPDRPYRGEWAGGEGYCMEKPVDCPPGMTKQGESCVGEADASAGADDGSTALDQETLGSRGWGTEQDSNLEAILAENNFQNLRSAYGLGSEAALNQTADTATLANGAVMWGGEGDAQNNPFIANLGGQYGDLKSAVTPTGDNLAAFTEVAAADPGHVWGAAPEATDAQGTVSFAGQGPWAGYKQQAPNEYYSQQPTAWSKILNSKKPQQGAYGAVDPFSASGGL